MDTLNQIFSEAARDWNAAEPLRLVVALLAPVVAWVARKPAASLLFRVLNSIGRSLGFELGDKLEKSLVPAMRVSLVVLGGLIALESARLPEPYYQTVGRLLVSVCVAAVFASVYSLCQYIPQFFHQAHAARPLSQVSWVVRVAQFIVLFIGVAAVFRVWGVDLGPVLTGMGLAGAAVALAAQDYLKNLLAGFNNAAERRFGEGDWIKVDGLIEGTVESVDLRSTVVRRFDKAPVYVPNSELANNLLINFSRCPHRRIYWKIALTYTTPIDALRKIRDGIERYVDGSERFASADLAPRYVRIDAFNDSSIDMLVLCFSQSTVWGEYLAAKEELALAIKSIVADAGGGFAFPSRSIYVEASPDEDPAVRPPKVS